MFIHYTEAVLTKSDDQRRSTADREANMHMHSTARDKTYSVVSDPIIIFVPRRRTVFAISMFFLMSKSARYKRSQNMRYALVSTCISKRHALYNITELQYCELFRYTLWTHVCVK